jgi:hypothetical protein
LELVAASAAAVVVAVTATKFSQYIMLWGSFPGLRVQGIKGLIPVGA